MILSDRDIRKAIKEGKIIIDPITEDNIGPCSVDLTLSDKFLIFKGSNTIDPKDPKSLQNNIKVIDTKGQPLIIQPKQFILAMTREKIGISKDLAATLEGRSSIARLGIIVHAAGLVSPGSGMINPKPLVLEVFCENTAPIKLYPGMRIVQIIFHKLTSIATVGYDERKTSVFSRRNNWISFSL